METHKNIDSFERFIRDQSDQFRMYPTKRVWYSIYNDLHPGRKWPSISICILLLSTLLMIGFLNSNNATESVDRQNLRNNGEIVTAAAAPNSSTLAALPGNTSIGQKTKATAINSGIAQVAVLEVQKNTATPILENIPTQQAHSITNKQDFSKIAVTKQPENDYQQNLANTELLNSKLTEESFPTNQTDNVAADFRANENNAEIISSIAPTVSNIPSDIAPNTAIFTKDITQRIALAAISATLPVPVAPNADIQNQAAATTTAYSNNTDRAWAEQYAQAQKPQVKKWKGKLSIQSYITPSVVFRSLNNNTSVPIATLPPTMSTYNTAAINGTTNHSPSFGVEAGAILQYPIAKGVRIKGGLQLNFTRFNISAFEHAHPVSTGLAMNTDNMAGVYMAYRSTFYANYYGIKNITLHNQTWQLSMPIGADIRLAGNEDFGWHVGSTLQPTLVFSGKAYLLSADKRNYVNENGMISRFNLNAAFETFVSFKTGNGLTWQIGPQFRRQLLSTTGKQFTIDERLNNYGIKIGVTKMF
jgi:hypothetical protein